MSTDPYKKILEQKKRIEKRKAEIARKKKERKKLKIILTAIGAALIVLISLLLHYSKKYEMPDDKKSNRNGELIFLDTLSHVKFKLNVEIADNEYQLQKGLMYRDSISYDEGMLFIFPHSEVHSMWMKSTKFPLDIVFADSNKKIITIHKNTEPLSRKVYFSKGPSKYAVEVKAGLVDSTGIALGDEIRWFEMLKK